MPKIAVFHWGVLSIHTCYLVQQLTVQHINLVLYVYTPRYIERNSFVYKLINEMREIVEVVELQGTFIESLVIKLNRVLPHFRMDANNLCINPFLPPRTRKFFNSADYDAVITVAQLSLFWLFKCDPNSLKKTLHYSLEVFTSADPGMKRDPCLNGFVKAELQLLPETAGLIIQDESRAEIILPKTVRRQHQQMIYLPVSVPGSVQREKSSFLHERLQLHGDKIIVLYFGASLNERKVDDLVTAFAGISSDRLVLVLHGDPAFRRFTGLYKNVYVSSEWLPFAEIDKVIASASIGICFYDNGWPNTRLTAFSSEKIARYTKAGVPFLAFENESYARLKQEFNCCELVSEISTGELEEKFERLLENYDTYRNESFLAFRKYYNIETTIKPLVQYIHSLAGSSTRVTRKEKTPG